jgi:subtilisin family serine protease
MLRLAALLILGLPAVAAGQTPGPPAPWVPGRILVTLDPAQAPDCLHCALHRGDALPAGVAQANAETGMTSVTPVVQALHASTVDGMYARYRHRIDDHARVVNPARARRAMHWDAEAEVAKRVLNTYVVELAPGTDPLWAAATYLGRSPAVVAARPDYNVQPLDLYVPNDRFLHSSNTWGQGANVADLWGIRTTGVGGAWQYTRGAGVRIAIQDTGVEVGHRDLAGRFCINADDPPNEVDDDHNGYKDDVLCGYNFAQAALGGSSGCGSLPGDWGLPAGGHEYAHPCDHEGHGTAVAGIALGSANGAGIVGMAPEATLMPLKIFALFDGSPLSGVIGSIMYAIAEGADVVNASWGCASNQCDLETLYRLSYINGVFTVAAAGNDNTLINDEPARHDHLVFTVGAHDRFGSKTDFSDFGPQLDLVAPGGGSRRMCTCPPGRNDLCTDTTRNILSTKSFQFGSINVAGCQITNHDVSNEWTLNVGTSMAAPHASGAAALVYARFPWANPADVTHILRRAATDVVSSGAGWDIGTGFGRLDAGKAVVNTVWVRAFEDAWVDNSPGKGTQNFGSDLRLRVDGSNPKRMALLKFDLTNVTAHQGVGLRLCTRPNAQSGGGGKVYTVDPNAWNESTVTWATRPPFTSGPLASIVEPALGTVPSDTCIITDITPYVHPHARVSLAIEKPTDAADGLSYWSREGQSGDRAPHLVVTTCQPTGCRTCTGVNVVEANSQFLPLVLAVALFKLYEGSRRRPHDPHRRRALPRV